MKKIILFVILFSVVFSCSKEIVIPQYTLTVTSNLSEGGSVSPSSGTYNEGTSVSISATPNQDYLFINWTGSYSSTDNPLNIQMMRNENLSANFDKLELIDLEFYLNDNSLEGDSTNIIVSQKNRIKVIGIYKNGISQDITNQINISSKNNFFSLIEGNMIVGSKKGIDDLIILIQNKEYKFGIKIDDIEKFKVPSELKSDGKCSIEVPVIIINYFPTNDGIFQDEKKGPTDWNVYYNPTLEHMKEVILENVISTKNAIEEGTRFRDFGRNQIEKSVCINVEKYYNIFSLPLTKWESGDSRVNRVDWKKLFPILNIEEEINKNGVKEIWFGGFQNFGASVIKNDETVDKSFFWGIPESNMSSPLTGDISNSWRIQNDLPIYNNTYIVYALIGDEGLGPNLHCRGHQIEVMLSYLDKSPNTERLFENLFVGKKNNKFALNGRVGNVHFPPNAEKDYDYVNKNNIESDIFDWKPSGGKKSVINSDTWLKINYSNINFVTKSAQSFKNGSSGNRDWSNGEAKWHIMWTQSIPNENNNIEYNLNGKVYKLTNWWDLFYNWDEAIRNKKTLWE